MLAPASDREYLKKRAEEYRREQRALAEAEEEFDREEREAERNIRYFTDKYESSDENDWQTSLPIASD